MPERLDKLRAMLAELETELESINEVDDQTRTLLVDAKLDIENALQEHDHPSQWEPQTIIDRLSETTQEFETSHPTLSGLVQRMIHALGQMGI